MASSTGFHLLRTGYICPGHEARVLSATANHCTESPEMCNGQGVTTTKHKETSECRKHKKQEQALREEEEKSAEICEVGAWWVREGFRARVTFLFEETMQQ